MRRALVIALALFLAAGLRSAFAQGPYLFDLLEDARYRSSFDAMLAAEQNLPDWLLEFSRTMNGVASPSREVWMAGNEFRYAWVCQPHNCGGNELHILFAPDAERAWALLIIGGSEERWLGRPDEYVEAAIRDQAAQ
jgi:hypothetical protein